MELFLVRHGQSEGNLRRLLFGRTDYELTALGIDQARECADKLRDISFDVCFSSPLKRASQTAEICIEGRNVPLVFDESLCEQDMGILEDLDFEEAVKNEPDTVGKMMSDWTHFTPPDGESFDEMYNRVKDFCDRLIKDGRDSLVVAHNGSLSMMTSYLLGTEKRVTESFYLQHGCYSHIHIGGRFRPERNTLIFFNK